ncbi:MAG: zinc-binding dehydrogenase [Sandaracinaceae bacterium]|jgi:NADPH:quinone reductase-like Zn-dependent oxidoreductase|nr:zinc-binding dehydrogenase [Sandaracinaceae bacterium]
MRALWNTKFGGIDALEVRESEDPTPAAGEVRIRVKGAGLNFSDIMARQGLYLDAPKFPTVMGYEGAGVVDALGEGVTSPAVGTRVCFVKKFGAQADVVCVPTIQALPIPDEMSFEEAAGLPVVYITAYHMIHRVAHVRSGESVLIHMAAGGVGLAALQLCKAIGNVTTFGTASASKHDVLREQGCTHPIDRHNEDYVEVVRRITNGRGADVVLDPLGGKDWKKGFSLLPPVGRLITFGFANMASGEKRNYFRVAGQFMSIPLWSPLALMDGNRTIAGVNIGHLWGETHLISEELGAILALYRERKISPRIDATYSFAQAGEAHRRIQDGKNVGKIVLTP